MAATGSDAQIWLISDGDGAAGAVVTRALVGLALSLACGVASCDSSEAPGHPVSFTKITLHRDFVCEGASFADFDGDGIMDVVAGPEWYRGPSFTERHALWARRVFDPKGYSDCFFEYPDDFDGDGKMDVLVVGFPGQAAVWYRNPGDTVSLWEPSLVTEHVDNESPWFTDLDGDGVRELVMMQGGRLGVTQRTSDPHAPWTFQALTEARSYGAFTHGLGVGDVDGDGHLDLLEATGYLTPERHDQGFGKGGAQMFARDLDGDGDADVVTTLEAHGYGLAWFEQTTPGVFVEHDVVPERMPVPGDPVIMHQPHALAVADLDGDGLADLVSGERFWGHVPDPPDLTQPARLYWFRQLRDASGTHFEPALIDEESGVGTQLVVGDLSGDGRPDLVIANKKGAFVFVQR